MQINQPSMDFESGVRAFSENNKRFRITFDIGRAEAAERQRRSGNGDVTNDGYVRETGCQYFADMAAADPDAEVEVIE